MKKTNNILFTVLCICIFPIIKADSWELQIDANNYYESIPGDWIVMGMCDGCNDEFQYNEDEYDTPDGPIDYTDIQFFNLDWVGTFDEHGRVISFGSFSKILAPGLRAGWIHSSGEVVSRFSDAAVTFSGGGFNHFASALIKEVIDLGLLESNVKKLRSVYSERSKTMASVLLEEFGDIAAFQQPKGGYYYWLKFPEGFDTTSFLPLAENHGVSFRPGNAFSESGRFTSHLRLTYTLFESADLAEGIRRLSTAYQRS